MTNNILAQLKSSEWTLEVIMASSNSAKNMRPVVRIKLQFEDDDELVELELSLDSFADLRYKVAEAIKITTDIKENNIVQTAASAGESLAAGVIFTIPALVLLGYWDSFNYFEVAKIAAIGGIIGVLFTVPLRRALIINAKLK